MPDKQAVGRFVPEHVAEAIHAYLMTRPCQEALDLVMALRQSQALYRAPK